MSRWDALLEVQSHDTTLDQIEHRVRTLPERDELEKVMTELGDVERAAGEVEDRRKDLTRSQQRLEDEIASLRTKADQHDRLLYGGSISNPRELQALQEEIGLLRARVSQLEDQELEILVAAEPVDDELARLDAERSRLDDRGVELRATIAERETEAEAETGEVRSARATAAGAVDDDLLAEYERLRPTLGGIAIARFAGGSCGGCHLRLSAVEVARIKTLPPDEPVYCEECGRLLAR